MKKIIVAKSAGFCFGVSRSVDMAQELLKEGEAYSLGQLIHNDDVVNRLASMGMKLINSPEELPEGERVIIRSHGVSKEIYDKLAQRSARITDATCREQGSEDNRCYLPEGKAHPHDSRQSNRAGTLRADNRNEKSPGGRGDLRLVRGTRTVRKLVRA